MQQLKTDYLVVGSGAVSMAFVDTMLSQSDATFIIVDKHHLPGGHWNDAYSFVRLHQPSALYGVESTRLDKGIIDESGPNKGYFELASGAEISAYFQNVMQERFIASKRVQYFGMHEYKGDGVFKSLLSDSTYQVTISKSLVDGTFFNTSVPSTHTRRFAVAQDAVCIAPNDLPKLAGQYEHYCILGGGKTAMDANVWLLSNGAKADSLTWVCPRESWLINRAVTQPGKAFFKQTVGSVVSQFEAMLSASSTEDLFLRLEAAGNMLRINKSITPTMFHYATISTGEVGQLRRIKNVIRNEKVLSLNAQSLSMQSGATFDMPPSTLFIDCTATAAVFTGERAYPIFDDKRILLQATYAPLVTYSAAIIAFVEANITEQADKNKLCTPVILADTPQEWIRSTTQNMMNQNSWNQVPEMRDWLNNCRLNPSYAGIKEGAMAEPANQMLMQKLKEIIQPALMNASQLR